MASLADTASPGYNLRLETSQALVPELEQSQEEGDKHSMEEKNQSAGGEIDYEKMENQQIGVTRIETLWRHFGDNKHVLSALGLSIFRESLHFSR
jgi:hypothetical protein